MARLPGHAAAPERPALGAAARLRHARRLVGEHGDRAPPPHGRPECHRVGRGHRLLGRAVAGDPRRLVGAVHRLRPLPLLRCGQARPGGLGRRPLQGQARRAHRLGPGLRHPVRRPRGGAVHAARDRAVEVGVSHALSRWDDAVATLAQALRAKGWHLATAESCTGGLIAAACTAIAGSSDWFERGFVTYSNEAKTELIGVPPALIAQHGAVSAEVAQAMAEGALRAARVELAVAVTGIAGPGGATPGKPVGTVWLAVAQHGATTQPVLLQLDGSRSDVREQTVDAALAALLARAR
ncbi:CinA family protein [Piscinibacter sp. HJYY11]|nr:CinA family protein [Piscinibacter sp. HJYY11]